MTLSRGLEEARRWPLSILLLPFLDRNLSSLATLRLR